MSKLSVVITSFNNADLIEDCLKSVSFADEVILVDNGSTDQTLELARKLKAKIFPHLNNPANLNQSKNFGFSKAHHPWILSLDSDERVEPDLKADILKVIKGDSSDTAGYLIPRKNIIFGQWIKHGLWYPDDQLRLFKNGQGTFPAVHNHELLQVNGPTLHLSGHILHYNYQTVSQYLQKIDRQYSDNEADVFLSKGGSIYWYDAIRFPLQDFITNYFGRGAYKDGLHGLVLSLLQAFYMFIVFCKIWERQKFFTKEVKLADVRDELVRFNKQFKFWYFSEVYKNTSSFNKFWQKLRHRY